MLGLPALVALTDTRWFEFLFRRATDGRLDEVNFWRPMAQTRLRALPEGAPFFFRLKHPVNAVVGYGFFVKESHLPVSFAWEAFEQANGDPSYQGFLNRIAGYRRQSPAEAVLSGRGLTCLILREVRFLAEREWVAWGHAQGWQPNIVAFKMYDLTEGPGLLLAGLLRNGNPPELAPAYQFLSEDERRRAEREAVVREGQGAFRVRVLDAYSRRCSVTGERSLPVLEAAHIQPYLGPASNHVQNGLSLRADIHRLYDAGYVTVTPEYRFEVSRRLREEFENGDIYYRLDGSPLLVLPHDTTDRPSAAALEWHASNVYRG